MNNSLSNIQVVKTSSQQEIKTTFKTLLLQKGCLQQELADFCGVSKAYISPIVNGKWIPNLKMRLRISSFFNCDTTLIWRTPELIPASQYSPDQIPNMSKQNEQVRKLDSANSRETKPLEAVSTSPEVLQTTGEDLPEKEDPSCSKNGEEKT